MGGAGAEPGQQAETRRHLSKAGEMVLDKKGAVIAEGLGFDIVLDELAETLTAVGVGAAASSLGTAEQSKSHSSNLLLLGRSTARIGARRGARRQRGSRASPTPGRDQ